MDVFLFSAVMYTSYVRFLPHNALIKLHGNVLFALTASKCETGRNTIDDSAQQSCLLTAAVPGVDWASVDVEEISWKYRVVLKAKVKAIAKLREDDRESKISNCGLSVSARNCCNVLVGC